MSGLTLVLGVLCTSFITYLLLKWISRNNNKRYPKGPVGYPIIGHLPLFGKHPPTTFMKWSRTYGDIFSIRMGSWDTVVVNGYDAVKATAELPNDAFSGRPSFESFKLINERINEETLVFGNLSPSYLKQRKLTANALRLFTSKRPEIIEELVSNEASALADILIRNYNKTPGNMNFDIQTFAVRISFQLIYGRGKRVDIEKHVKVLVKANNEINKFSSGSVIDVLPWLRYIMPWRIETLKKMIAQTDDIMSEEVRNHYETFSKDETRDLADAILASDADDRKNKDGCVLTRARLNQTLSDLLGAGTDTTHKILAWLFIYMAAFPRVQERVHAEIDKIVGKGQKIKLKDKSSLVYTNAVIHEVMRIATLLPFALPHYVTKDVRVKGVDIDNGTVAIFNIHSVHHEKDFWGDPECFRPERLILDNNTLDTEKLNHILPFSIGRRRCVGEFLAKMTVFLSFSIIMQMCKFVKPSGEPLDLTPIPGLNYSPKDFNILVQDRA